LFILNEKENLHIVFSTGFFRIHNQSAGYRPFLPDDSKSFWLQLKRGIQDELQKHAYEKDSACF
jgi:hypothetical protein